MASQPGCIHFKPDTVQHTYQSPIPVSQHYKTAIKNNLHVEALDQKDPKKKCQTGSTDNWDFPNNCGNIGFVINKNKFQFCKKDFFFLSKLCTHDYYQTFTIHELKKKEKYIDKT